MAPKKSKSEKSATATKRPRNEESVTGKVEVDDNAVTSMSAARNVWLEAKDQTALDTVESFYKSRMALLKEQRLANDPSKENELTEEEVDLREKLLMLLLQSGRAELCVTGLRQLGYTCRLATCVLDYDYTAKYDVSHLPNEEAPCIVVDNALPNAPWEALRRTLAPLNANYWTSHAYNVEPPSPYFSFVIPMERVTCDHNGSNHSFGPLGVLIREVMRIGGQRFGEEPMKRIRFAELWAHNRPHASGHQLHFDSDDEGRGGVRNPTVTSVCFLEGEVGGPTLMTNQRLGDRHLGTRGWLCPPKVNRIVVFDGKVLHGVIPGKGVSPSPGARRVTLMIALWEEIVIREGPPAHGSARIFPSLGEDAPLWVKELTTALPSLPGSDSQVRAVTDGAPSNVVPLALPALWERTDCKAWPLKAGIPPYDEVYQGF